MLEKQSDFRVVMKYKSNTETSSSEFNFRNTSLDYASLCLFIMPTEMKTTFLLSWHVKCYEDTRETEQTAKW
jgi:hypothetical protein